MFAALRKLVGSDNAQAQAQYLACVARARNPYFYAELGVPDTLDGRFEMIVLELTLLLKRTPDARMQRALMEAFFSDMDHNIREFGIDMGLKKRMRAIADGFNGRRLAYDAALDAGDETALLAALKRNVYGTLDAVDNTHVLTLAQHVRTSHAAAIVS